MKNPLIFISWFFACNFIAFSCKTKTPEVAGRDNAYYREIYRPQFHFSPETGWMNDPNGLVFYDGEYHLFYQFYPDSTVWGPMHWGHAISTDLLHWKHLPVALYPDSLGYIFSGSAVADINNTSGFGTMEKPPLVAIFTYHDPVLEKEGSNIFQNQGIAFSTDKGRTWKKYSGNPVIKNPGIRDFRDPKMFWNKEKSMWELIMAVKDRVHIYSSLNLKNWTFESEFGKDIGAHGGVWECPDLFPLKVEGSVKHKWVMLVSINPGGPNGGSATQYFTGEFDGHIFIPDDTKTKWIDWGRDNYAGVTWSDIPESDGRRLFIGWMSNWDYATSVPTGVWRSASTLPRELSLKYENGNYLLTSKPIRESGDLRTKPDTASVEKLSFNGEHEISTGIPLMQSELLFSFSLSDKNTDTLGIILENDSNERFIMGYAINKNKFYVDRRNAGNSSFSKAFPGVFTAPYSAEKTLILHVFVDASSVEIFAGDGSLVMTNLTFPGEKYTRLKLFSKGGQGLLNKAVFHGMHGIWLSKKL